MVFNISSLSTSWNKDSFIFSFPICVTFIFLACCTALAMPPVLVREVVKVGVPALLLILSPTVSPAEDGLVVDRGSSLLFLVAEFLP